jgi:hypothetical protein
MPASAPPPPPATRGIPRRSRPTLRIGPAVALACALALPAPVMAQVCIGGGAAPGQFALNGHFTFQDGQTGWGLQSAANLEGPVSFGAGFGTIDQNNVDSNWIVSDVWILWERTYDRISVCPRAGVIWATWGESFQNLKTTIDDWSFPLGLAVAMPYEFRGYSTIPSLEAGVQWTRFTVQGPGAGDQLEIRETGSDLYLIGGLTILMGRYFVRGEARLRSDSSDSLAFRPALGIMF